jgi:prophage regulatory protein
MNSPAATHNIETAATEISALPAQTIIRLKQVIALTGLSRSTIYDRMNPKSKRYDASFPKSIKLGAALQAGAVGWIESEIQAWIQQCIAERTKLLCN